MEATENLQSSPVAVNIDDDKREVKCDGDPEAMTKEER